MICFSKTFWHHRQPYLCSLPSFQWYNVHVRLVCTKNFSFRFQVVLVPRIAGANDKVMVMDLPFKCSFWWNETSVSVYCFVAIQTSLPANSSGKVYLMLTASNIQKNYDGKSLVCIQFNCFPQTISYLHYQLIWT